MAASIYDLDEAVIEKYDSYFALLDTSNRGILDYVQCTPLFEKANLPAPTLASVVALADSDGDWRLDKKDFRIAMHLLYLAVQGHPVPTSVPAALAASARGADVGAPVDAEPSFGHSSFAGNFSQQPAAMPAPPAAEAPSSSWAAGWNAPPQDASWSSGGQRPPVGEPPPAHRIYADEYHQPERRSSRHSCMSSHSVQGGGSSAPGAVDLLSCSGLPPQSRAGPTSLPPAGPGSSEVGAPLDGEPSFGFSSFEEGNFTSELAAMPSAPWKEATNSNWAAASTAPAQDSWSIGGQRPPGGEPLPSHAEGFHQSQRRNSRNSELAVMPSAPRKEAPNSNWAAASNAPAQDSWSIGGQRPPGGEPLPRRTDAEGFHQFQRRNSRNSGLSVQPVPESGSVSTSRPAQPGAWAPGFEMDVPLDGETSFGFSSFESNFPEQSARMPAARSMEAPSSSCAATSNAAPQDAWSNGGQRFGGEAPLSQRAHAEGIPQMEMVNSKSIFLSKQSIPGASLPGEAAIDLLSRSGLPLQDLDHIKRLADWDKDGSLSLDEFCIAMHLVARRKLGEPLINELPSSLRPPLAWPHAGTSDAMHMPTVDTSGGQIGSSTGRLGMENGRNSLSCLSAAPSALSQPPAPYAASPVRTIGDVAHTAQLVHSVVDSFNVNAAERARYERIFREKLHPQNGRAAAEEVRKFFQRSKLATEDIDRVVRLSDVNLSGSLSESEFCVAMQLVAECRKGKTLPNSLPAEVRDSLISSKTNGCNSHMEGDGSTCNACGVSSSGQCAPMDVLKTGAQQSSSEKGRDTAAAEKDAAEKAAAEEKAATERRWKVSPEARLLFGSTFETTVGVDGTRMQRDRAMRHILRSGVAQTTVEDILRVVAPSGGRLDEGQFVIAMLLASRLAEGIPMPTPLPEELAQALAGRDEPPPAYNPEHNWDSNSPPKVPSPPSVPPADGPQPSVGALRRAESVQLSLEADLLSLERTPDVNLVAASKPEEVHASNLGHGEANTSQEAQLHEFFPVEGSGISAIAPLRSNDRPLTERAQPSAAIHAKENRDVNSERPVYWEHTQLRVAHEALHEAQMQLITRQHEASDVSLRIAAVQAQRKAVQEEYAECVSRLRVVRGQCMEYSAQLETRRRELQAEQRELARAAADVKDSQTKAEAYLSEAQTLAHSLQVARDELRRLKHSHTSQLRAAHLSSRQLAPERSELAQVRAEIGVLKQQVEQADLMEMTAADASIMAASSAELKAALEEARLERQMLQDELQRERHERRQLEESAADVQTLTVMQDQLDRTHAEAEQIQAELQHLRMVAFAAVGTMEGGASAAESSLSLRAMTPHPKRFSPTQPQHVQQQQSTPPTWSHSVDGSARHVDAGVEPLDRRFTSSLHRPVALDHNTAGCHSSVAAHDRGRAFDGGPVRTTKHHHDLVDARHDMHTKAFMRQADTGEDNTAVLLPQSEADSPRHDTSVQHGWNTNNDTHTENTHSSPWRSSSTDGRYAGHTNELLHAHRGEDSKQLELAHAEVLGQQAALQTLSVPRATEQMISPATSPQPIEGPSLTPGREMIDSEESLEVQAMGKPLNASQIPGNQRSPDQEVELPTELDEVKKKRQAILADFEERASSIRGRSPLKELWLAVAEDGPREIKLAEKPELSREMLTWTPERQAAAIRLLCYQRSVNTVDLSGLAMGDLVAEAFADVLRTNSTMLVLNIERNDFREAGLIAIAEALGENTTLQELRLAQQKMPVSFKAETILGQVMAEKNNTLCKLGLALRDTNARTKVNSATSRNTDFMRLRRRASQKDVDNQPQTFSPREHSTKRLSIRGTPDEMSDATAAGASKASTKEAAFSPVASVIASEAPPFVADAASFDAEASAACTSTFDAEASSVNANNLSFGADNSMFGAGDSTFDTDFSAFDATASNGGADSSTFGAEALGFGAEASAFGTENSLFGEHTSAFDAGSAFGSTDAAGFGSTDASGFGTADAVTLGAEAPASGAELSAFGIGNEASTFDTDFSAFEVVEPAFGTETSDFPDEALAFPAAGFGTENSAFEADASAFGADAFGAGASEFDAGASGFGVDASGFGTDGSGFETSASAFGADTPAFGEEASAFGTTFDTFGDQASTFGVTADGFGNEGSLFETDGVSAFDADASSFGNEAFGETSQVATTHDGFGSTNDFGDGFSVEFADDGFGREGFEAPLTSAAALPQEAPPDNGFPMSATATSQDVLEMAEFLEMKVDEDPDLLWIARAALEGDDSLPDDHFKELYRKHREMKKLQQKVVFGSGPLGLELTQKGDQVVVTKVLPDTQAFFHHVQEGATIVAVNDIPMNGMSRDAVLQQIRIAPRPVQLTFMNSSKSAMQGSGGKARDVPTTRWPEQTKALGEMGFTDAATVSMVLDETGGDVDAALTRLFQMG